MGMLASNKKYKSSAPVWSARCSRPCTTPTATARSTTPWSAWPSHGTSGTCSSTARATSAAVDGDSGGGLPLHRVPHDEARRRAPGRHRQGDGRASSTNFDGSAARARGPAVPVPQPAGQRGRWHRRRYGHQDPAAQPARGHRRLRRRSSKTPPSTVADLIQTTCPGPDFPTAGTIYGRQGHPRRLPARAAGASSCGATPTSKISRATAARAIIIDELPYQVNKARLMVADRSDLVRDKTPGWHRTRCATSPTASGMRVVVELKKRRLRGGRAQPPLQAHRPADHLRRHHARHRQQRRPRILSLKEMMRALHRRTAAMSSCAAPGTCCARPSERAHILAGLPQGAGRHLDEVIALIRGSADRGRGPRPGSSRPVRVLPQVQARRHPGDAPAAPHRHGAPAAPGGVRRAPGAHRRARGDRRLSEARAHGGRARRAGRQVRDKYGDDRRTEHRRGRAASSPSTTSSPKRTRS